MRSLLLRLTGPMQSWGVSSRFIERDTLPDPTKSGVIGLLCAALGVPREEREPVLALARLPMAVRVDRKGVLAYDYQTAQGVLKAGSGKVDRQDNTVQSWRYYLADAAFLVGLQAQTPEGMALLEAAGHALSAPRFALSLGRGSYLPSLPVYLRDGLGDSPLEERLTTYPYLPHLARTKHRLERDQADPPSDPPSEPLGYVLEARDGQLRNDVPTDAFSERRFGARFVQFQQRLWGEPLTPTLPQEV